MSATKRNEYFQRFNGKCAFCGRDLYFRGFAVDQETDFPICLECRKVKGETDAETFRKRLTVAGKIIGRIPDMVFEFEKKGQGTDGKNGTGESEGVRAKEHN